MKPVTEFRTQSTLLIPSRLLDDYEEKANRTNREMYFHYLIKKYKPLILMGLYGKKTKVKTVYQNEGENLVKRNFRPFNIDWLEFEMLAGFLGISKTALFVWLLTLDIADWYPLLKENVFENGVPPVTDFLLQWKVFIKQKIIHYDVGILYHHKKKDNRK